MNPKRLVNVFFWAALGFVTGCGTLERVSMYADPETFHNQYTAFYPATDYDLVAISTGGRDWLAGGHGEPSRWEAAFVVPFHVLDIPISIATDTLCIPVDIVQAIERHREKTGASGLAK